MISDNDLRKIIAYDNQLVTSGSPISVRVSASIICEELLDARARIAELEEASEIADKRLIDAAAKARVLYVGCDTPDQLADRVAELEAEVIKLKKELEGI